MNWRDIKILLFMVLLIAILILLFLIMSRHGSSPSDDDCVQSTKIGGAFVIGEKRCDKGRSKRAGE